MRTAQSSRVIRRPTGRRRCDFPADPCHAGLGNENADCDSQQANATPRSTSRRPDELTNLTEQYEGAVMRVVITGVSRGLGRAMADEFIRLGHTVAGTVRRQDVADELTASWPQDCRVDVVDVRDDEAVARWAEAVLSSGPVDRLINSAAVMNAPAPLWEVGSEEMQLLVETNILGTANVIRRFTPAMVERGEGVIVNFSSGWGRSVSAGVAPYCATKYAIEGLTMALAEDLPAGLAAVPLNPGVIDTDMLQTCFGDTASTHQKPNDWAARAVPFILQLTAGDNGQPLAVNR